MKISQLLLFVSIFFSLLFMGCGNGSFAGATGVGNPSSSAVITVSAQRGIVADTADLVEVNHKFINSAHENRNAKIVNIDTLTYHSTKIEMCIDSIAWETVGFNLTESSKNIHVNEESVILTGGPWVFDLLTGKIVNGERLSVNLPSMKYKSMNCYVNDLGDKPAITIVGIVTTKNSTKPFKIEIPGEMKLKYMNNKHSVVEMKTSENISLIFNYDNWFGTVNLYDHGKIVNDTLLLTSSTGAPINVLAAIRNNIRKSGILRLKR